MLLQLLIQYEAKTTQLEADFYYKLHCLHKLSLLRTAFVGGTFVDMLV
jgi:hypothetical protein